MGTFIIMILSGLLGLLWLAIIISAVLSWLVAFNVINIHHPVARSFLRFLDAVTEPILRPLRRVIPPLGGIDLTPIVALIIISAARVALLPWIHRLIFPYIG